MKSKKQWSFILIALCLSLKGMSQEGLFEISKNYFRSSPYETSFGQFLEHLMKDPDIRDKETMLRSDTSLFYFGGSYKTFNPFFFKPEQVAISLFETPLRTYDSLPPIDTIMGYQIIGYVAQSDKSLKEVKNEFQKIHRRYSRRFSSSKYQELKSGTVTIGEQYNYFVGYRMLSPLAVSWMQIAEENRVALVISLRIKVKENEAILPELLNNP